MTARCDRLHNSRSTRARGPLLHGVQTSRSAISLIVVALFFFGIFAYPLALAVWM